MTEQEHSPGVSRRGILKAAGWAAGTLAAGPILSAFEPSASHAGLWPTTSRAIERPTLRIGVLLPASNVYPTLGDNLVAGMDLGFKAGNQAGGRSIELVLEATGFGSSLAIRKSRKLLEADQVDLVVGVVSSSVAAGLSSAFHENRSLLIVSNIGANVVRPDEQSPHVFYNSLGYWQANWAMGAWAAGNLGQRALVASSFYDGGYDSLYAFQHGFEARGGEILQTYVTHTPTSGDNLGSVLAAADKTRPDFVYACYCGQQAGGFVKAYAESGLSKKIPLVGSGFLTDDRILPMQGKAARGIKTCLPWADSLDTPESTAFSSAYEERTGRRADAFAVLGHDTAQLILHAVDAVQGRVDQADELKTALGSVEFASPRGVVRMNPRTQSTTAPLYLREVRRRGRTLRNVTIAELDPISEADERGYVAQLGPKTGWLNAYLSA